MSSTVGSVALQARQKVALAEGEKQIKTAAIAKYLYILGNTKITSESHLRAGGCFYTFKLSSFLSKARDFGREIFGNLIEAREFKNIIVHFVGAQSRWGVYFYFHFFL